MKSVTTLVFVLVAIGILGSCKKGDRPTFSSVILISIDTLRADRLSCYGHTRATSPGIDRMAAQGARFDRAFTTAPWTVPAHLSLLTGNYPALYRRAPSEIQAEQPDSFHYWLLDPAATSLAEMFKENGFATAAFVDTPWLVPALGFDQGFDTFDSESGMNDAADPNGGIRQVLAKALRWLDSRKDDERPFFMFLHVFDVHGPFTPPPPFDTRFVGDAIYESRQQERYPVADTTEEFGVISSHLVATDREDSENPTGFLDAQYDGGVAFVDAELEVFIRSLEKRGLLDRATLAITADHGESLGEHDFFGHGVLYGEVMRIPLILRNPSKIPAGTTVSQPVALIDVAPTLLELSGVAVPSGLHGLSLVPALSGSEALDPILKDRALYLEGGIRKQYGFIQGENKVMLRFPGVGENMDGWLEDLGKVDPEGRLERIEERFDLGSDPLERIPLTWTPDNMTILTELNSSMRRAWEAFQTQRQTIGAPETSSLDERRRLRELGYLNE